MQTKNSLSFCPVWPTPAGQTDSPNTRKLTVLSGLLLLTLLLVTSAGIAQPNANEAFLPGPVHTVSTIPSNGDVNPYGVAFICPGFQSGSGPLKPGDILVSNFNNSMNLQGTGTTIVRISAKGAQSLFLPRQNSTWSLNRPWHASGRFYRCGQLPQY